MKNKVKYKSEKMLHEVIRDLPRAAKLEAYLDRGMITIEEALSGIAEAIREEKQRAREAAETK